MCMDELIRFRSCPVAFLSARLGFTSPALDYKTQRPLVYISIAQLDEGHGATLACSLYVRNAVPHSSSWQNGICAKL